MVQESVNCPKCSAQGWTKATPINASAEKEIPCGNCGHKIKYNKKKWKPATVN